MQRPILNKRTLAFSLMGALVLITLTAILLEEDVSLQTDVARLSGGTMGAVPVSYWQGISAGNLGQTWFTSDNWKKKVPSRSVDVIIDKGSAPNQIPAEAPVPVDGDTAATRDLYVYAGGRLTFASFPGPGALKVHGTWHVAYHGEVSMGSGILVAEGDVEIADQAKCDAADGTIIFRGKTWKTGSPVSFFAGTGTVVFAGSGPQRILGDVTFHDLDVRTADTVFIAGHVAVAHELRTGPSTVVVVQDGASFLPPASFSGFPSLTTVRGSAAGESVAEATISKSASSVPVTPDLEQNFPNPFNPTTTIRFTAATEDQTTLKVYDIQGREIATLFNESTTPGRTYAVAFDGTGLSSGTYLYILQAGAVRKTGKMSLMK